MSKVRTLIRNISICDLDLEPLAVESILDYAEQLGKTTLTLNSKKKKRRKRRLEEKAFAVSPMFGKFVKMINEMDSSIVHFCKDVITGDDYSSEESTDKPTEQLHPERFTEEYDEDGNLLERYNQYGVLKMPTDTDPPAGAMFDMGEIVLKHKGTENEEIGIVFSRPAESSHPKDSPLWENIYLLLHVEDESIFHSHVHENDLSEIVTAIIFDDPFTVELSKYIESIALDKSLDKWHEVKVFAELKGKTFY